MTLPAVVAHADWSLGPDKRWIAKARLERDSRTYTVSAPTPVGDAPSLLRRLTAGAAGESVLVGFDFPIGLPRAYADVADVKHFTDLLPALGHGQWASFYEVAELSVEISPRRPFFPRRPGGTSHADLLRGLGVSSMNELLRSCEKRTAARKQACSLFWTLGGNQVGKAAISGWRDVLAPALRDSGLDVGLWPFDGTLEELLESRRVVTAETYPAEFYHHLGLTLSGSKRAHSQRAAQAQAFHGWCNESEIKGRVVFDESANAAIDGGFGPSADGEDPFDAFVGLLGMLNVLLGRRSAGWLEPAASRAVEGWILGQAALPDEPVASRLAVGEKRISPQPETRGTSKATDSSPLFDVKAYDEPSLFTAASLLREARRQRALGSVPVPAICILDPDGDVARHLEQTGRAHTDRSWACYHTRLLRFELAGEEVGIVPFTVGAPFAVLVAEELVAAGCLLVINLTSAGRIAATAGVASFMVIEKALRDEGTSLHYRPAARWSSLRADLCASLAALEVPGATPLIYGASWTTDAPFRETAQDVERHRAAGVLAVEMEAAALYAFAEATGNAVVCLAHLTNELGGDGDFEKGEANGAQEALRMLEAILHRLSWARGASQPSSSMGAGSSGTLQEV